MQNYYTKQNEEITKSSKGSNNTKNLVGADGKINKKEFNEASNTYRAPAPSKKPNK